MLTDVQRHVASCPTCQLMKSSRKRPAGQLELIPPPERAWQQVTMDFVNGLPAGATPAPPCCTASPGAEPRRPVEARCPTEPRRPAEPRRPTEPRHSAEPRRPTEPHCPAHAAPTATAASAATTAIAATAATAATAAIASPNVLTFDAQGRAVNFDVWSYHPTLRRVLSSPDVMFDESVSYYRLFPYRTAPPPPPHHPLAEQFVLQASPFLCCVPPHHSDVGST
ncbi:unnamed protein product [Closterium sp. NIES-54]